MLYNTLKGYFDKKNQEVIAELMKEAFAAYPLSTPKHGFRVEPCDIYMPPQVSDKDFVAVVEGQTFDAYNLAKGTDPVLPQTYKKVKAWDYYTAKATANHSVIRHGDLQWDYLITYKVYRIECVHCRQHLTIMPELFEDCDLDVIYDFVLNKLLSWDRYE